MTARLDEIIRFSKDDISISYQAILDDLNHFELGSADMRPTYAEFMVYSSGIALLRQRGWQTKIEAEEAAARIRELEARVKAQDEALCFYANEENWTEDGTLEVHNEELTEKWGFETKTRDEGHVARECLARAAATVKGE